MAISLHRLLVQSLCSVGILFFLLCPPDSRGQTDLEPPPPPPELGIHTGPLVASEWLAEHLEDPDLSILDARHESGLFLKQHLPGAQHLSCENLRTSRGGIPDMVLPIEILERIIGRLGINQYTHVVIYGKTSDDHATLVGSILRMAGMQRVSILDGGIDGWVDEGYPTTDRINSNSMTRLQLTPDRRIFVDLAEVRSLWESDGAIFIDARSKEDFEEGHIPGARHRPSSEDVADGDGPGGGRFRDAEILRTEYETLGADGSRPVILYCMTGHRASLPFFTLRRLLGYSGVRIYDGSWIEWLSQPDAPREPTMGLAERLDVPPQLLERARGAARSLMQDLMMHLKQEMNRGGPLAALGVCYEVAPAIAAQHSKEGMTVRRISNRIRNSADAPDSYERVMLRELDWQHRRGTMRSETAELQVRDGKRILRYMRPILVQEICLPCHGDPEEQDPDVRQFLEEHYPDDEATGYSIGDLRGAVSVQIELNSE